MTAWQKQLLLSLVLLLPVNTFAQSESTPPGAPSNLPIQKYSKVLKGRVPSDPKYLDYMRWYVDHAVVSVIIRGEDRNHLYEALGEIQKLRKKQVLLGNVVIIGKSNIGPLQPNTARMLVGPDAYLHAREALRKTGKDLTLKEFENAKRELGISSALSELALDMNLGAGFLIDDAEKILTDLGIEFSPAWIVRYHGKNYIYEGVDSIAKYFGTGGQFLDGETHEEIFCCGHRYQPSVRVDPLRRRGLRFSRCGRSSGQTHQEARRRKILSEIGRERIGRLECLRSDGIPGIL